MTAASREEVAPPCGGHARWDDKAQAEHVASSLDVCFGTIWQAVPHADHFHVIDTGVTGREGTRS